MYPVSEQYKQKIQQPARQFAGRVLIPKLTATFTRNSIAYKPDGTQVGINEPRFEEGQFGKAIMVEEGTVNRIQNPFFTGLTSWGSWNVAMIEEVNVNFNGTMIHGIKIKKRTNGTANAVYQFNIPYIAGSNTLSFYAMIDPASVVENGYIRAYITSYSSYPINSKEWTHIKHTEVKANSGTATIHITQYSPDYDVIIIFPQFEQKPYATSFIDGTRAAETLNIPTAGVLNPQEGTVGCWVYVNGVVRRNIADNWSTVVLIRKGSSVANWIWLHHNPAGTWVLQIRKEDGTITGSGSFSDSLTPDGWHYFAVRWNVQAKTAELFHNGVKRISLANVIFPAEYDRIEIGHRGGSADWVNSLIDGLRISQRARTDEEILETYERWL